MKKAVLILVVTALLGAVIQAAAAEPPDRLVVLTFDDSVASHARFVAPYLKELGFGATFFITEGFGFKKDKTHYMTWGEIKELHDMGFEIGNHTRAHKSVAKQSAEELKADILHIEEACKKRGIPRPVTFCYPGYASSPEAVKQLAALKYSFARAGGARAYDPKTDNPLLVPQAFDGKPRSTLEQFIAAAKTAKDGKIAVMTFHGVPDIKHPWVNTEVEKFKKYMQYLKDNQYTVVALRDLAKYLPPEKTKE